MFGKQPKDPARVYNLVSSLRSSSLNTNFATDSFKTLHAKINNYLTEAVALSSGNTYFLSLQRYSDFCVSNGFAALPIDVEVLLAYFVYLAEVKESLAAILTTRSALRHFSLIHRPLEVPATDSVPVQMFVKSARRKLDKPVKKSTPMEMEYIRKIVDLHLEGDQLKSDNFAKPIDCWQIVAKTVLKFFTFARFEEVLELKKSNFEFLADGDLKVIFTKAKNNQFHDARSSLLTASGDAYCPVNILRKYFLRINSNLDHFFLPRISRGKVYLTEKTCYSYCLRKYRETLKSIGVVNYLSFGEHSDKSGGISAAANAGADIATIQVHGRLKSSTVPMLYHRQTRTLRSRISNILNNID